MVTSGLTWIWASGAPTQDPRVRGSGSRGEELEFDPEAKRHSFFPVQNNGPDGARYEDLPALVRNATDFVIAHTRTGSLPLLSPPRT